MITLFLFGILILFILVLFALYITTKKELHQLHEDHMQLLFDHKSLSVKHGKTFEQLFPYMKNYPYETRNFRFIGTPIDGLSFEDDHIVFVEFKTGKSTLSTLQKKIKDLVKRKKVEWKEIRDR